MDREISEYNENCLIERTTSKKSESDLEREISENDELERTISEFDENEYDRLYSQNSVNYSIIKKIENLMESVENEEEEVEKIETFGINFNERNHSELKFQATTFDKTINLALKCPIEQRKAIAIYLNDDKNIAVNIFAERIKELFEYLNQNFLLWGFDCTSEQNKKYMQNLLSKNLINYDLDNAKNLPVLLVVGRFYGINEIISKITPDTKIILAELENSNNEFLRRNRENTSYLDFLREHSFSEFDRLSSLDGPICENYLTHDVNIEQDESENFESFGTKFNQKFFSRLNFQATTINETLKEDKGLVAVYLHNDNDTNGFCFAEKISQARIAEYLNENFILYGFDCASKNNKNYIQQLLNENLIDYDLDKTESLPVLLIVRRCDGVNEILGKITAETEDILAELENSYREFLRKNNENN